MKLTKQDHQAHKTKGLKELAEALAAQPAAVAEEDHEPALHDDAEVDDVIWPVHESITVVEVPEPISIEEHVRAIEENERSANA